MYGWNRNNGCYINVAEKTTVYSAKRLYRELADHGVQGHPMPCSHATQEAGFAMQAKLKFKVTTDSKHHLTIAPNLLKCVFFPVNAPDKVWIDEGWLYFAGVKDLFNGELVGYAMSEKMSKELVMQALFRAAARKHPPKG